MRAVSERLARCGCGRVAAKVRGEPTWVYACHCDFCQKRSGTTGTVSACFADDQVLGITGDPARYNGLETDGAGVAELGAGVSYYFCSTCGSTVYFITDMLPGVHGFPVGSFVDPNFPPPVDEFWTELRHPWDAPFPDAEAHPRF
jgi:hypothetical protein